MRYLACNFGVDGYRLPTEAEWEYACRAGSSREFCFGTDETRLPQYASFSGNSKHRAWPAGTRLPNAWGLFDMHSNVWEWCWDWYGSCLPGSVPSDRPCRRDWPIRREVRVDRRRIRQSVNASRHNGSIESFRQRRVSGVSWPLALLGPRVLRFDLAPRLPLLIVGDVPKYAQKGSPATTSQDG